MRWLREDSGVSLLEVMLAAAVGALVSAMALAVWAATSRTEEFTSEDSQAMAALRNATQRLTKELREAGKIYCEIPIGQTECLLSSSTIEFWVDVDGKGDQQAEERIIWEVAEVGGQVKLLRSTAADPTNRVAWVEGLVAGDAFAFNLPPPRTTLVTITFTADVDPDSGPGHRQVRTDVRLRNAPG